MALETATYINQLVSTNPLGSDPIASGDDHIRLIKATVKATFPNITGPVDVTQAQLNSVANAVQKDGSVAMTGALTLPGNPSANLQAAPKQYVDAGDAALNTAKADKAITVTGTGAITGGGDLSANRTLDLATTGVTAGTYGSATKYAKITVNSKGQVTAAEALDIPSTKLGAGTVGNGGSFTAYTGPSGQVLVDITANMQATYGNFGQGTVYMSIGGSTVSSDTYYVMEYSSRNTGDHPRLIYLYTGAANSAVTVSFSYSGPGQFNGAKYSYTGA